MTPHEQSAVGLYAVLAYDAGDFVEMVAEEPPEVLSVLYLMLATPNAEHDQETQKLNELGLVFVKSTMKRRGQKLPEVPSSGVPLVFGEDLDD